MGEANVKDARIQLSALLHRVEKGEEIVITHRSKRVQDGFIGCLPRWALQENQDGYF